MTNPTLSDSDRRAAIKAMMRARIQLRNGEAYAEQALVVAKEVLGEIGPVWWDDGAPDLSGAHPSGTIYAEWWDSLPTEVQRRAEADAPR